MSNDYISTISDDEQGDYPKITQADLERSVLRVGLKPTERKQRVIILLDSGLVAYFKAQAGERGYQTLINETLRQAVEHDDLEERLRRIIPVSYTHLRAHATVLDLVCRLLLDKKKKIIQKKKNRTTT